MKILLTGANGYIGQRLLPLLVEAGHTVVCLVRDPRRFTLPERLRAYVTVAQGDLLRPESLQDLPPDLDAAYYLVHSMSGDDRDFVRAERQSAENFTQYINRTTARQVVYLSGIANDRALSAHLRSRRAVEKVLQKAEKAAVTVLRASIIIGSGSASFEIIRDLVEKLPVMITPRWLNSRCQPIGVRDVMFYLTAVLDNPDCVGQGFDIGGPDVLTYKQMLLGLAEQRGYRRYILTVPVLTPRLSSLWLFLVTSTTFSLAQSLVESLRNDTIVSTKRSIAQVIRHECMGYAEALKLAFTRIEQNEVVSSWTDALSSGVMERNYMDFVQIPQNGMLFDRQQMAFTRDPDEVLGNVWSIGGERGWYKVDWLWRVRGLLDKFVGGVGLRRSRRSPTDLRAGDQLDFWRVLVADRPGRRLLLYAEMKLPGEAWLQFRIVSDEATGGHRLEQLAAFRPRGLAGRLYWYSLVPFHFIIFKGMVENIVQYGAAPGLTAVPEPARG
ncbi:NAD-dependent epimerase/dehydratase [Hymenobacter roseosalivarius DSM 11622]|uniref:NAD-dependent epimerase/dehydratase n=1 Tax=Hymenobacter roseosalivarius DSM 11622 TaxID=645990 RepID=A0A1W1VIK6_9BACT|nr:SDR family oxidoreductase [Hymenobacter roseosalivarius]SMB92871.1 NAD-dependent epimerase/dehydratase [Hymenobacter roseosalivarius DSM 11622]